MRYWEKQFLRLSDDELLAKSMELRGKARGKWSLDAIYIKDFPVVQATSLILAVLVVTANIIVDIVYSWLDPRVRLS